MKQYTYTLSAQEAQLLKQALRVAWKSANEPTQLALMELVASLQATQVEVPCCNAPEGACNADFCISEPCSICGISVAMGYGDCNCG